MFLSLFSRVSKTKNKKQKTKKNKKSAIWNAGAAEDYRVATAPSGEPLINNMSLAVEGSDAHAERAAFRPLPDGLSAYELWQVQKRKLGLRQEYLDHWNSTAALTGTGRPVDAIISPMAPYVAPPHGKNKSVTFNHCYSTTTS